jgi:hypothetical protein
MTEFISVDELERFERKWRFVFTCFALVLAGALFDHMLRSPSGKEAFWCYSWGGVAFAACLFAAHKLRDAARHEGVIGGLELLGEDLSPGDLDD